MCLSLSWFVSNSLSPFHCLWCSLCLPPAFLFINLSLSLFAVSLFFFYLFLSPPHFSSSLPVSVSLSSLHLSLSPISLCVSPYLFFLGISISVSIIPDLPFSPVSFTFSGFLWLCVLSLENQLQASPPSPLSHTSGESSTSQYSTS